MSHRAAAGAAPLSFSEQMQSVALGAWMILGLFLDGWAHNHQRPETLLTPWHAVFYSGFLATAWHSAVLVRRRVPAGRPSLRALPVGLRVIVVGLGLFGLGAVGDQVWHSIFGIEVDVAALLSPTHLLMLAGGVLVLGGPFRTAWAGSERSPAFSAFLPALLSITLVTALVAFFFMYLTPFRRGNYGTWVGAYTAAATTGPDAAEDYARGIEIVGVASVLVTTVVHMAPVLLILLRWRPPFGTAAVLFSSVTALVGGLDRFDRWQTLLAAPLAGLTADLLIRRLQPGASRPLALRMVAAATPAALWLAYFALFHYAYGLGWEPDLWGGVTAMAALTGAGLSLLAVPPTLPAAAPSPAESPAREPALPFDA